MHSSGKLEEHDVEQDAPSAAKMSLWLPKPFLLMASALHLTLTMVFYLVGRLQLVPSMIDRNGIGYSFAYDSFTYRAEAAHLVSVLAEKGGSAWWNSPSELHVKLYSLCFTLFGSWLGLGFNILSAAPLNLFYYLLMLTLVFKLGQEVFNRRAGLIGAGIVAVWPSLLVHSTQLLRDPLFISCMLAFILLNARWLTRRLSWMQGILIGAAIGPVAALIWIVRLQFWEILLVVLALGSSLYVVRLFQEKRVLRGNLAAVATAIFSILLIPRLVPITQPALFLPAKRNWTISTDDPRISPTPTAAPTVTPTAVPATPAAGNAKSRATAKIIAGPTASPTSAAPLPTSAPDTRTFTERLVARLDYRRQAFATGFAPGHAPTTDSGSNIDTHVRFKSVLDVLAYVPRAMQIAYFAPFPSMWVVEGKRVGGGGRLISGFETLVMYGLQILSLVALWKYRRRPAVWLLVLTTVFALTPLGLVVANIGALYRLRYGFWMLLIVLAGQGIVIILDKIGRGKAQAIST